MPPRILVLGGTGEARELSGALIGSGYGVVTSLAGVTQNPAPVPGEVRRGGFGGEEGLVDYLRRERIDLIADATHPYAAIISNNACAAAVRVGVAYCRLERPAWMPRPGDRWIEAETMEEAAALLPAGSRVFLTIGKKDIAAFIARADLSGIARMIEEPVAPLPARWKLVQARPPFDIASETRLLLEGGITHLITKNSGGDATAAKLVAARETNIPVVMIARPSKPVAHTAWPVKALTGTIARLLSP